MKAKRLLFLTIMALCATSAWAYDFSAVAPSGQTLYYNIVDGNAQVTYLNAGSPSYYGLTGDLVIPANVTYNNITYSVTSIGSSAFTGCTGLTSVTIGNSVTSIGGAAFYGCTGLTSVTIPNSVTSIGWEAFYGCTGLTSVTIPNSVTSIYWAAFSGCTGLTSVTIPNSVTSIGSSAFSGCTGLTSVAIPNSVTSIGHDAFRCSGLTSVTIPNSVTSIGYRAFSYCSGLTSVIFNADSCTSAGLSDSPAFQYCTHITNFTFGDSVKVIPSYLCSGLTGLTSVTISNSVTSIGERAFYDCSGLTSVTIPNSVTSIGNYAFFGCSGLTSLTIGNSVTSIGDCAFYYCTGLTSVTIPNSVTSIGQYAFSDCSSLTSVTIGNSVTSIGVGAFSGCSGLTQIIVSSGNTHYDSRDNCNAIIETTTNTLVVGCQNTVIPNSVTSIGHNAFRDCSSLTSVTIPNSVTSIGERAFYVCSGLTSVTIPNSVTFIDDEAFACCFDLTSVTIGNSVTYIGDDAFHGCSGINTVYMMPEIAPNLGAHCFYFYDDNYYVIPCVFYISCGSYDSYFNGSGWDSYRTALHELAVEYELSIGTSDSIKGTASIIQQNERDVACDSSAIIIATASYGYHFDHWSNGNTANPDTLHLVGDSTVTAIFAPNQYVLTVQSADESHGSTDGSGTYDYLDTVEISATGINHHHFLHWNDGNRDNPRRVVIACDTAFTATFAIDTHTVNVVPNDPVRGMVTQSGTEFEYLSPCTVEAIAYSGYTFVAWSNGMNANPYTFAVQSDVELTAYFLSEDEQLYTVTVVSADPTMGTVSGGGQALDGGTVTIRAAGNPGYHFLHWNDNNTDSVRTVEVHGNVTYTAYFASNSTEAIDDVNESNIKVYAIDGRIVVEGRENRPVWVLDMYGRVVDNGRLPSGVYLVKVGTLPARKVVVIR